MPDSPPKNNQSRSNDCQTVHLLWTGGWDSTYRLLSLALFAKCTVQPHYIVDPNRASTEVEQRTMRQVREFLERRDAAAGGRVRPTLCTDVARIEHDQAVDQSFEELRRRIYVGRQYEWLARYARQHDISALELCVHKDDKAHQAVEAFVTATQADSGRMHVIDSRFAGTAEFTLFERFRFPLFELTKLEMERHARREGFLEGLELSWFCFSPYRGKPCGLCNPCVYTIEEGLGRRIPFSRRLRYHLSIRRRVKSLLRRFPNTYGRLQSWRRGKVS